ncbi:MAG: DUF1559 domain-containing protein [Gemmataceae bacterium]|nr:DUF1559 domain-containing protein [Gemmataceae bacterium]
MPTASVTDGLSNTVAFAERCARPADGPPHYWINQHGGPGSAIPSAEPKYPGKPAFGPTFYTATDLPQFRPSPDEADAARASGFSPKGVQVAMLDGSVRMVGRGVGLATWQAAHTPRVAQGFRPGLLTAAPSGLKNTHSKPRRGARQ